jgi:phosphohistidine phosphatase
MSGELARRGGAIVLLYLIRHAEAEDLGAGGVTRDFDRPLTARGRADSRVLAESFLQRNIVVDAVAASPLVRAHQTAAELASVFSPALRVVTCDELAPGKLKPGKLSDFLANLPSVGERLPTRESKAVVAVGHMPELAEYCEWLMGADPGTVRFAKAGASCMNFKGDPARGAGSLEWLVTMEWVRGGEVGVVRM